MAQEISYQDLHLDKALVVESSGLTVLEAFTNALKNKKINETSLQYFQPLLNGKSVAWDTVVKEGDLLQVLPHIAGGY
jgi:molybdopterin converting factor small subunit